MLKLLVEPHIQSQKFFDRVFFNFFFIAPLFLGDYEFSELGAPVADVVPADYLIAFKFVKVCQGVAKNSVPQMSHVHWFGDIRGGVLNDDFFFFLSR